jgi:predicted Zn-dependent protease
MRAPLRLVLFSIALCGPATAHAKTELLKTKPGSVVHWAGAVITVAIDVSARSKTVGPDDLASALARAVQTWNAVRAEQPRFSVATAGQPDVTIRFCRGRWQGETIDLGRSKFTASLHDGTVTAATVEINECDHAFAPPDRPAGTPYDLQAVLTHELGHVLGLGHSNNHAALMYPSGGGANVRTPHLEDQTTLALIYLGRAAADPAPGVASARPGSQGGPAAQASVDASLHAQATAPASAEASPPPADAISLLNLKNKSGHSVMVYTCEPTLLPPMETAPARLKVRRTSGGHAKASGHRAER